MNRAKKIVVVIMLVLVTSLGAGTGTVVAQGPSVTENKEKQIELLLSIIVLLTQQLELLKAAQNTDTVEPVSPADDLVTGCEVEVSNLLNPISILETSLGTIEIELFEDTMPITAGNFKKLVIDGFYDGVKFHRVIENFIIQGGDPITKTDDVARYGTGGPGYAISDEHNEGELLTNIRGTISMANSGPSSGGSQFFINLVDNTNLDFDKQPLQSKHPVFGQVVSGMEVVDAIAESATSAMQVPLDAVVIKTAKIKNSSSCENIK